MRIVLLNWKHPMASDAGGAERYAQELARHWCRIGHDVTLVVPADRATHGQQPSGMAQSVSDQGYGIAPLGARRAVFRSARRLLRGWDSALDHVVELVSTRPFCAHEVVGRRATALYLQMARDVWDQEYRLPISWLGRHVLEPWWTRQMRSARVVVISRSTGEDLARHRVPHVAVVPPGCEAPSHQPARALRAEPPRLVWVGRMVRTKRPDHALEAFKRVAALRPGATLDIIGDGYLRRRLERNPVLGVTFHGFVPEATKHAILDRAHLMLMPGTREGWGITVMEAAGHGVPSVAYDVPGLRDAVVDGQTGVLTAPTSGAMARAALSLLDDPARWDRLSAAGAARAREYTWARAATSLLQVIEAAGAGEL